MIVVAATNRPDVLDPALLRPGRFDRQVILDRPDMKGRTAILKVHTKGKPLDKAIVVEDIAKQSPGFSGADLANLVNEAAILSARRNKKVIGMAEFQEALERIVAGPERKSRIISDAEKAIKRDDHLKSAWVRSLYHADLDDQPTQRFLFLLAFEEGEDVDELLVTQLRDDVVGHERDLRRGERDPGSQGDAPQGENAGADRVPGAPARAASARQH